MKPMGRSNLSRKAAEATYLLGKGFKERIKTALGLNQKHYKFHSLPQPSIARYHRLYMTFIRMGLERVNSPFILITGT